MLNAAFEGECGRERRLVHARVSHQSGDLVSAPSGRVAREVQMPFFVSSRQRVSALCVAASAVLSLATPAFAQPKAPPKPAVRAPRRAYTRASTCGPGSRTAGASGRPCGRGWDQDLGLVQLKPEPSQPDWVKVCGNDPSSNQQICYTTRDFVSDQGQPVLAVAIYDVNGKPEKISRFILPLGLCYSPGVRSYRSTSRGRRQIRDLPSEWLLRRRSGQRRLRSAR